MMRQSSRSNSPTNRRPEFKTVSDPRTPFGIPYQDSDSPLLEAIIDDINMPRPTRKMLFPTPRPSSARGLFWLARWSVWPSVVALPGNLFLRALRCLIVPMVFCVMTVVVAEAVAMGRTSMLRFTIVLPYVLTSVLATVQGIATAILLQFTHHIGVSIYHDQGDISYAFNTTVQCANGLFLTALPNGTIGCAGINTSTTYFANATASVGADSVGSSLSLMDQVVAITDLIVPVNIFASLANGDLLSIVLFAIPVG
ncbi:hypothetical protein As57867_016200, partial [Aphanomyces stellatus]